MHAKLPIHCYMKPFLLAEYTIYVFDRRMDLPKTYSVHDMARDTAPDYRQRILNFFEQQSGEMRRE